MTVHLVTFADESMSRARELCLESGRQHGVDNAWEATEWTLAEHNFRVDWTARGFGYWQWKPWLMNQSMEDICDDGDILIYADAGVEFINSVSHIIDRTDQDIFLFGNNWEHAHWCKADIVEEVIPPPLGKPYYRIRWEDFGKQAQASVIFFRVSDYTRKFVKEWLDWCLFEGGRLIDDSPSRTPNHPEFQENRHDQSILTTMAYREGIKLHWWPAIYNDGQFTYEKLPVYAGDNYPPIFHHHRKRNHEWSNAA